MAMIQRARLGLDHPQDEMLEKEQICIRAEMVHPGCDPRLDQWTAHVLEIQLERAAHRHARRARARPSQQYM